MRNWCLNYTERGRGSWSISEFPFISA